MTCVTEGSADRFPVVHAWAPAGAARFAAVAWRHGQFDPL
jgi:hypothetical protein